MINYANFTPYSALIGGALIGLSASILLLFNGKICGISGITGQLLSLKTTDKQWRISLFMGLFCGGLLVFQLYPTAQVFESNTSVTMLIVAGLLVGYGTRLGNGCTSGHGICGISRLSFRSIMATIIFMGAGIATVYILRHVMEGVVS